MVRRRRGRSKITFCVFVLALCFLSEAAEAASCWIAQQQQQHPKTRCGWSREGKQSQTRRCVVDRGGENSEFFQKNTEEINFAAYCWKDFLSKDKLAGMSNNDHSEGLPIDTRRGYYSLKELESFAASRSNQSRTQPLLLYNQSVLESKDEDGFLFADDDTEDALNLDTDEYLQAAVNPDGSILSDIMGATGMISTENSTGSVFAFREAMVRQLSKPAPNSPTAESFSRTSYDSDDEAMQQLWQAMQQQQKPLNQSSSQEAEEIHRQILAQEEGFRQQSALFKASLTNSTKAAEAAAHRHGERFRKQQAKALQKLEEQMKELEQSLMMRQQNEPNQQLHCGACGCRLSQDEIRHWQKLDDRPSPNRRSKPLCQVCYAQQFVGRQQKQPRRRRYTTVKPPLSSRRTLGWSSTHRSAAATTDPQNNRRKDRIGRPIGHQQDESVHSSSEKRVENPESTEPWQRVIDPDTGEVFYWNEVTEEMRWDL